MKWFRHQANASNDDFIEELECVFGLEGYARWWKMLETIAAAMDKNKDEPSATHSIKKWCLFLKAKQKILTSFLLYCENKSKIKQKANGNILTITCPKLLEMRDEFSRKSGHAPDRLRTVETETETETEEEKKDSQVLKKKPSSLKKPQDEDLFFSQFWNVFPSQRRADREGTFKAWKRATANTNPKIIIDAASIYRESSDVFRGFAKGPTAWLNQKCWEIDYQLQEEPEQHQTISAAEIHKIACTTG